MANIAKISPCLWFDHQGEEAARYYVSIFKNAKVGKIVRYGKAGQDVHQKAPGSVMVVEFELEGQSFTALNGGPEFKFNEAISLQVFCETQQEIDYYWDKLSAGGDPKAQVCGWVKDKYGLSWQVVPTMLRELMGGAEDPKSQRMLGAMMEMKKLDIAALQRAYDGKAA